MHAQDAFGFSLKKLSPSFVQKLDKDGDGVLSEKEKELAKTESARQMEQRREEARKFREAELLKYFDLDKDGQLSDEEKALAEKSMEKTPNAREAKYLLRYDTDRSGDVNNDEYKAAFRDNLSKMMTPFDLDGDGAFNEAEQAAFLEAMNKRREAVKVEARKTPDKKP